MKCYYDGSQRFLKGNLCSGNVVEFNILTEGVFAAKLVYTEDISETYSKANKIAVEMRKTDGGFSCKVVLPPRAIRYRFELNDGENTRIYFACGLSDGQEEKFDNDFIVVPDFDTPEWSKGAVWYQIMPDAFFNGDTIAGKSNANGTFVNCWANDRLGKNDYYGGDLFGIARKVEYLKSLSVDVVSVNPVWMTTHQAGYGSFDIEQVDATFGGINGLKRLIEVLHKNGIKIILDGVFQYYHKYGKLLNEAKIFPFDDAERKKNEDMFLRNAAGEVITGTWGHPTVDYSSAKEREMIAGENSPVKRYLKLGADGWRLDVGNTYEGSNQDDYGTCVTALGYIYDAAKSVGKDKLVLTEHPWGEMFSSKKCESKWNYNFGYQLRDWAAGKIDNKNAAKRINAAVLSLPRAVAQSCFNFITTHDLSRILYYCNGDVEAFKAALAVQFAFVGSLSIYSGDEVGMVGSPAEFVCAAAPTSFGSFEWNEEKQNKDLLGIYKQLAKLRREKRDLFINGSCFAFDCGDNAIAVIRSYNDDTVIAVGNVGNRARAEFNLPFISDGKYTDIISGTVAEVKNGKFSANVSHGCAVYAKNFGVGYLNGFEVSGDVRFVGDKYVLSENSYLKGVVYGCFDVEVDGNAVVEVGSVTVSENFIAIGGKRIPKKGKVELSRNEYDTVSVFNNGAETAREKVYDGYTVPVTVYGGGETRLFVKKSVGQKLVADEANGINGMFDQRGDKLTTGNIEGDFSAEIELLDDGGAELITDGAGIGVSVEDGKTTFYRRVIDDTEVLVERKSGYSQKRGLSTSKGRSLIIERFGYLVSAYVSDGKSMKKLGEVKANYSESRLGIKGELKKLVFGDGKSRACPHGCERIKFNGFSAENSRKIFRLNSVSGKWKGCEEGIVLTSAKGAFETEKTYKDFELFFTLTGRLNIKAGGVEIGFADDGKTNYAVKRKNDEIRIYSGMPLKFEKSVECNAKRGKIVFEFFKKGCVFGNFWIQEYDSEWTFERGNCYFNKRNELKFISDDGDFYAVSSKAFSDIALAANVRFNKSESCSDGDFYIISGHSPFLKDKSGFAVRITHSKKVEAILDGETIASEKVDDLDPNSFFIRLIKKGNELTIRIAPSYNDKTEREVVNCKLPGKAGGVLAFYGRRISGTISDFIAKSVPDAEFVKTKTSVARPTYIWLC